MTFARIGSATPWENNLMGLWNVVIVAWRRVFFPELRGTEYNGLHYVCLLSGKDLQKLMNDYNVVALDKL